jgi:zinc protease
MEWRIGGALAAALLLAAGMTASPVRAQGKQAPPAPLAARPVAFPVPAERTLANGLTLLVVERHDLPVAAVNLYLKSGTSSDPAGREGLATLVADLVTKGTKTRTAQELASQAEGAGGSLDAEASEDWTTISSSGLAEKLPLAFELVSDVARNATFPADQLETSRKRMLSALQLQLSQPQSVAGRVMNALLYGAKSPYGASPTPASVQGVTAAELKSFYADRFRAGNALLVVSGDVTPAQAEALAKQYLGDWTRGAPVAVTLPAAPSYGKSQIFLVHRPGSVQSNILVGTTTTLPGSPDYRGLEVGSHVLGGGTDSRLFRILREQKSWTYGAYATLDRPRLLGSVVANTEVRTAVTDSALVEMLKQIGRLQTEPVPAADLTAAKGFMAGSFPLRLQSSGQIADQVARRRLLGLPLTDLTLYREKVQAVTPAEIQRVSKKYLDPKRLVIVVVGDAPKIKASLEKIAPVTLLDVEGKPLDAASLEPKAAAIKLDGSLLKPMSLTYSFSVQGNKMGDVTTTLTREGDLWLAKEDMTSPMMSQTSEMRLTAADLTSVSVSQTMSAGAATFTSELKLAGGKITGTAALPPQMGGNKSYDTAVPPGTMLPGAAEFALMVLPLEGGRTITLPSFNLLTGAVDNSQYKITGPETVTVAAGTFEAYKVEIGGDQPRTIWVRKDLPHIAVKTEMTEQPVSVELTAIK